MSAALTYRRGVSEVRRPLSLLRPRWLLLHLFTVAAIIAMVWLGRWQWHAAIRHHGEIRNYAYAFQWWAFTVFAGVMWWRIVRDYLHPEGMQDRVPVVPPSPYVGYTPPAPAADATDTDPERARFNDYLQRLNANDRRATE